MLGETEKSSDVCRTASLSEIGHEQRATTSSTVTDQRRKTSLSISHRVHTAHIHIMYVCSVHPDTTHTHLVPWHCHVSHTSDPDTTHTHLVPWYCHVSHTSDPDTTHTWLLSNEPSVCVYDELGWYHNNVHVKSLRITWPSSMFNRSNSVTVLTAYRSLQCMPSGANPIHTSAVFSSSNN